MKLAITPLELARCFALEHHGNETVARIERDRARRYAMEIAADYSHPVVRSISFMLKAFWNKLYDGVEVHHFDTLRNVAPGHEVIFVPCHRSHVDYLLLSYQLLVHGVVYGCVLRGDGRVGGSDVVVQGLRRFVVRVVVRRRWVVHVF